MTLVLVCVTAREIDCSQKRIRRSNARAREWKTPKEINACRYWINRNRCQQYGWHRHNEFLEMIDYGRRMSTRDSFLLFKKNFLTTWSRATSKYWRLGILSCIFEGFSVIFDLIRRPPKRKTKCRWWCISRRKYSQVKDLFYWMCSNWYEMISHLDRKEFV